MEGPESQKNRAGCTGVNLHNQVLYILGAACSRFGNHAPSDDRRCMEWMNGGDAVQFALHTTCI